MTNNINNLSNKRNFVAGASFLPGVELFLTNLSIPGINADGIEVGGNKGIKALIGSDSIKFNPLNLEILIDEDYSIFLTIINKIFEAVNIKNNSFSMQDFNLWIEVQNNKKNKLFTIDFYNCKIESISDIELNYQDDITEHTMSLGIIYDYYEILQESQIKPTLRT